jgi:hypothetical protein
MDLLGQHFEEDKLRLLRHVLPTSYFSFNGQLYGQIDGVAVGSPLSPVIANFYKEDFEKAALVSARNNPFAGFATSSGHTVPTS